MADFIIAIVGVLLLLSGWLFVQQLARWYAARHPEFGPAREEGGGCGHCLCGSNGCDKEKKRKAAVSNNNDI